MPITDPAAAHPLLAKLPAGTLDRLRIYAGLLRKWQRVVNLVGSLSLDEVWIRHIADSLQVSDAVPDARNWLDLGSGAGLPGLVTAIKYAEDPRARVHLVESGRRKCAFLQTAARATGAPAIVHCGRIEDIAGALNEGIEAVSARALAPLAKLIAYAARFLDQGAIGIFPKGKHFEAELTPSLTAGKYLITTIASQTDPEGRLIVVRRPPAV